MAAIDHANSLGSDIDIEAARPSSNQPRIPSSRIARDNEGDENGTRTRSPENNGQTSSPEERNLPGSPGASSGDDNKTIVAWEDGDPENPYNWPRLNKGAILSLTMMLLINSTMGPALPSSAIPFIAEQYNIGSPQWNTLPISVFMIGYVFGPILWGPLSEQYGRRLIVLATFVCFSMWTMACALTPNCAALIVFRFFVDVFAGSAIAVIPGIVPDMYGDHRTQGRAMAIFMAVTCFGPLFAPIVSGFVSPSIGWRWSFWVGLILAGVTFVLLVFIPETFAPILLSCRAHDLREADPVANAHFVFPRDLEPKTSLKKLAAVVLARPIRMIFYEPIASCTCAFPIIFGDLYGLSPGVTGLTFLSIGGGSLIALPVFFAYDSVLCCVQRRAQARGGHISVLFHREEFRRLPLACLGGPLFVASFFWLNFSARDDVPVIVPVLAGFPFGAGYILISIALLNYLTDAYEIYAASANAASSMTRSLLVVSLPLAMTPMFEQFGIAGACSLSAG
ncbi:hypothetical protein QQX98_008117 [Neonectria punicea]|uniref:Major facilitator superfamily (MFS) profile domain-containing protein n=1 Tax=Neonectria punicea TaxID=979145 RepID=A0ABR1GWC3_9HYPO